MITRLMSMHPAGPVLLLIAVVLLLLIRCLPEKIHLPARLIALACAFAGAILCFML